MTSNILLAIIFLDFEVIEYACIWIPKAHSKQKNIQSH